MLLWLVAPAADVDAHLAVSRRSLRMLIADADLVVEARLLAVDEIVASKTKAATQRPTLRVRVSSVLKGPAEVGEVILSAQQGHGVARYRVGERALLFLHDIRQSTELQALAETTRLRWYSSQEHDDDWVLDRATKKPTLAAARGYVRAEAMPPPQRDAALRRLTNRLLASADPRLARSALRDLIAMPDAPLVRQSELPSLIAVIENEGTPIDLRVGLLAELQRRGLAEGDSHWAMLIETTRAGDRLAVIPAAGLHGGPRADSALRSLLAGPDVPLAAAAAVALGSPGNQRAVEPLAEALGSADRRLAMAAIRALGRVGTPEALAAIRRAASTHPDRVVRRRAEAEIRLLSPPRATR